MRGLSFNFERLRLTTIFQLTIRSKCKPTTVEVAQIFYNKLIGTFELGQIQLVDEPVLATIGYETLILSNKFKNRE